MRGVHSPDDRESLAPRKSWRRRLVEWGILSAVFVGIWLLCCVGLLFYGFYDLNREPDRDSALKATREWARLEPLPASAANVAVKVEGSAFTRGIRVSFEAPTADVERWLQASPGTREAEVTTTPSGARHFRILPGGKAAFAEVEVDDTGGAVRIYTYWS